MNAKKFVFILITASFTVILLLIFKYIPASSVPFIKNYVPIVYTSGEESLFEDIEKKPADPQIIIKESASVSDNDISYTSSQYHNFEKIIDELIIETKEK